MLRHTVTHRIDAVQALRMVDENYRSLPDICVLKIDYLNNNSI